MQCERNRFHFQQKVMDCVLVFCSEMCDHSVLLLIETFWYFFHHLKWVLFMVFYNDVGVQMHFFFQAKQAQSRNGKFPLFFYCKQIKHVVIFRMC